MNSAPPFDRCRVKDEGLLLSYFLNMDSSDDPTENSATSQAKEINRSQSHASYSSASVRFSADTTKTTTERSAMISSTPAVCFYPSSKHTIGINQHATYADGPESKLAQDAKHHMHHSFPSFNSMASSLLKDTWPIPTATATDSTTTYPLHSDVSPITPTAQIGIGQETLILPPPPISNSSIHSSLDPVGQRIPVWNYQTYSTSNSQLSHPACVKNTYGTSKKSFADSTGNIQFNHNSMGHLQWLHHLNSNVMNGTENLPSASWTHNHTQKSTPTTNMDFNINTPIEFVPTEPFLNALSTIQRDLAMDTPKVESEEKRARRLERNRESARQSRRRKKERLSKLAAKVQSLHGEIENEWRRKIECMEHDLRQEKSRIIEALIQQIPTIHQDKDTTLQYPTHSHSSAETYMSDLYSIVQNLGPNSPTRRAVTNFQYDTLRRLILSQYQHFILWLLVQGGTFLTYATEKHSKGDQKTPSKQIGETLTTERTKATKMALSNATLYCEANDSERFWPYFCNELSISVDQEEKIVQKSISLQDSVSLLSNLSHLRLALNLVKSLEDGLLYQSHKSAYRSESTLTHILTPSQSINYLRWIEKNKERFHQMPDWIGSSHRENDQLLLNEMDSDITVMNELCENLNSSLLIPTTSYSTSNPKSAS